MNSAATTNIQPRPRPDAQRDDIGRQHGRQQDAADHGGAGEAEGAADLDDLAIDREDRAHHAEIDREEHADGDQRDLRGLEMPSHRMNSGTQAIDGIARSACTVGSSNRRAIPQ
jgi:hypothetical protein